MKQNDLLSKILLSLIPIVRSFVRLKLQVKKKSKSDFSLRGFWPRIFHVMESQLLIDYAMMTNLVEN